MIKLSSEGYCIEAHKVGANTSALKFFIESYASSKGGWKGPAVFTVPMVWRGSVP